MNRPLTARGCALGAGVLLLAGCGFRGAYSLSLPGGADVGDDPYTVTVQFLDVLDLVPQSGVRVADVAGRPGRRDRAGGRLDRRGDRHRQRRRRPAGQRGRDDPAVLPARGEVRRAGRARQRGARGRLEDGALIPLDRTNRNVEVEELLGALSLVLNGGGLAQLQTITAELGEALEGREAAVGTPSTSSTSSSAGSTAEGGDQPGPGQRRHPRRDPGRAHRHDRDRARHASARASTCSTSSAACWSRCWRAWPGSATSAPG